MLRLLALTISIVLVSVASASATPVSTVNFLTEGSGDTTSISIDSDVEIAGEIFEFSLALASSTGAETESNVITFSTPSDSGAESEVSLDLTEIFVADPTIAQPGLPFSPFSYVGGGFVESDTTFAGIDLVAGTPVSFSFFNVPTDASGSLSVNAAFAFGIIPEPGTLVLTGLGLAGLGLVSVRRRV